MLKQLHTDDLTQFLESLAADYHLQVPLLLPDGSRCLGSYGSAEPALFGPPVQRKPTSFFFPQTETLVSLTADGSVLPPKPAERPLALFGLDRNDLAGIVFLDRFFNAAPADDLYLRNRSDALLIGLTGAAGPEHAFLPLAEGGCDIELIAIRGSWLARGYSGIGQELLQEYPDGDIERLKQLQKFSDSLENDNAKLLQASRLLLADKIPELFWEEIATRCIACGGCNFACPTCSCFCVQDRSSDSVTERSRVWDSCQLDAFMREASGHNPLGTEALRTRRRIHHKLAADVERWGELGCVACGRCDRACPTGIGIFSLVAEMLQRFGNA